MFGITNG
jgi:DNA polymerase delta subunit 1